MQELDALLEKIPAWHLVHSIAPDFEYVPGLQSKHFPLDRYWPSRHFSHLDAPSKE